MTKKALKMLLPFAVTALMIAIASLFIFNYALKKASYFELMNSANDLDAPLSDNTTWNETNIDNAINYFSPDVKAPF